MRFDGEWFECDDGVVRPVIDAEVLGFGTVWWPVQLLIDTGADRTVISASVLEALGLETAAPLEQIGGVGGLADSVVVTTQIRLTCDDGRQVVFRGDYAACTDHESLDMSVLGRDILDMFAVIADRPDDFVAILGGRHHYRIEQR
jgi:predicted aspartyl protease